MKLHYTSSGIFFTIEGKTYDVTHYNNADRSALVVLICGRKNIV